MLYKMFMERSKTPGDAYIDLTRLFFEKRRAIQEGDLDPGEKIKALELAQSHLLSNFRKGVEMVNSQLSAQPAKTLFADLADFYLVFGY